MNWPNQASTRARYRSHLLELPAQPNNGQGLILTVLTIVILGGVSLFGGEGSMTGVVLALAVVAVLSNVFVLRNLSGNTITFAIGILLVLAVLLPRLAGLIARRRPKNDSTLAKSSDTAPYEFKGGRDDAMLPAPTTSHPNHQPNQEIPNAIFP